MSNSNAQTVWNAVVNKLRAAQAIGQPLNFVKQVYEGYRANIPDNAFPCIILEPNNIAEKPRNVPTRIQPTFTIDITCALECLLPDKQIVGDVSNKGIIDFAEAVKNVLDAQVDLGLGTGIVFGLLFNTVYSIQDVPYRQADIQMKIEMLSTTTTR